MTTSPPSRGPLALYRGAGLPRTVKALGATSFLQDVASEMVYPLLPTFLLGLGGGPALLGAMESASEGAQALLKGAAGRWSDRAGRRKPFVSAGYGLSAATRPLMAAAAAAAHVVLLRVADRVAKGLRTAPRDALIAESTRADRRAYAFSFHRGLDHLGAALGPLFAALVLALEPGRLRLVFLLATVPAVAGWLTVQLACREPTREAKAATPSAPPTGTALPAPLRLPLAAFFVFSLGNASDAFLLLRAGELRFSPVELTLLWSGFHVAKWLASAPAGRLADRLGPRRPILAGWALYALVYLGFGVASGAGVLIALFALYAAYYGLTEGAERALVVRLAGGELGAGTSLGAFHASTGLGTFVASFLFGLLWQVVSPLAAFAAGAALAATAALLLAMARDPRV
jgi:MFS family permease